jgi:hypothetical protein
MDSIPDTCKNQVLGNEWWGTLEEFFAPSTEY